MTISPEAEFGFFGGHRVVNQKVIVTSQKVPPLIATHPLVMLSHPLTRLS